MDITVRKAEKRDYGDFTRIMGQVQDMHVKWRPDIYKPNDELISMEYYMDSLSKEHFYVAEAEGKVVGVLGILFRHVENPPQVTRDVLFIDTMAVDEPYRGRGVGHAFFYTVKELARKKGCDGIELQVNAKNVRAYEMYKNYGFTEKSINMELLNWKLNG